MLGVLAAVRAGGCLYVEVSGDPQEAEKTPVPKIPGGPAVCACPGGSALRGLLKEYDGTEKGFPDALAEAIPDISRAEAYTAVQTVFREAFGPERISRKDTDAVLVIYEKTCRHVCRSLWGFKKWYFQYGKVYW